MKPFFFANHIPTNTLRLFVSEALLDRLGSSEFSIEGECFDNCWGHSDSDVPGYRYHYVSSEIGQRPLLKNVLQVFADFYSLGSSSPISKAPYEEVEV